MSQLLRRMLCGALEQLQPIEHDAVTSDELVRSALDTFRAHGFKVDTPEGHAAARNAVTGAWSEIVLLRERLGGES